MNTIYRNPNATMGPCTAEIKRTCFKTLNPSSLLELTLDSSFVFIAFES